MAPAEAAPALGSEDPANTQQPATQQTAAPQQEDITMEDSQPTNNERKSLEDNDDVGDERDDHKHAEDHDMKSPAHVPEVDAAAIDTKGRASGSSDAKGLNADAPRRDAATLSGRRIPHFVDRAAYAGVSLSKLIATPALDFIDYETDRPANWVTPPERDSEALLALETLDATDVRELESVVGKGASTNIPHVTSPPPSLPALNCMLNALTIRREIASLLTVFGPDKLAERTFNLMSFLKRLLDQCRQLRSQTDTEQDNSVQEMLRLRSENDAVRREWCAMQAYWRSEVERIDSQSVEAEERFVNSVRILTSEHQCELNARDDEMNELREKLSTSEARCNVLRRDLARKSLNAWSFTDFLNADANVTITTNWKQLQELFAHFASGTAPPQAWITNINVLAVDQPRGVCGNYDVERKKAGDGDSEPPSENPPRILDLSRTEPACKRLTPSTLKPHRTSAREKTAARGFWEKFKKTFQLRPCNDEPNREFTRHASEKLDLTEDFARAVLPDAMVWSKVRLDVRYAIRAGYQYDVALKFVSGDQVVHPLFHTGSLVIMLTSIIYDECLDATPWVRYVPEMYFLNAETRLESMITRGEVPEPWHPLTIEICDQEVPLKSESSEDDNDSLFVPDGTENDKDVNEEDEDNDDVEVNLVNPKLQTPSKASRALNLSDSDSDELIPSSPPRRSPRNKRSKGSDLRSGPARKKARSSSNIKDLIAESPRASTSLADVPFRRLTSAQLQMIEVVDPRITSSFRYFGIKMYFFGKKSKSQTPGFPNYAPQKSETRYAQERWDIEFYITILPTNAEGKLIKRQFPWRRMFADRTKVFYFHRASDFSSSIMARIKHYVSFMKEYYQAWWDLLHWITIDPDQDKESLLLYDERRSRTDSLLRKLKTEVKRLRKIRDLFQEPGIWPWPQLVCHWIWEDPRSVDRSGKRKPLTRQLMELDKREPERTLWASAANETQRTRFASEDQRTHTIPLPQRARNWIVPGDPDNEIADENEEMKDTTN